MSSSVSAGVIVTLRVVDVPLVSSTVSGNVMLVICLGTFTVHSAFVPFAAVAVITAEPAATPSIVALWLSSLSTITFAIFSSDVVHVTP